jgi:hypothetical protein
MRSAAFLAAIGIAVAGLWSPFTSTDAATASMALAGQQTTTADDVYNSDIALVRDVRQLQLARGVARPALHGHRRHGQPGDRPLPIADRAGARRVLEQNYEYDLLEPDKLLRKYVGREVTLVRTARRAGRRARRR